MTTEKKPSSPMGILGVLAFLFLCYWGCNQCTQTDSTPRALTRSEKIEAQFSGLYGDHKGLREVIKTALNDPDSYEAMGSSHEDKGDHILIVQEYTAKNAFGGRVRGRVVAKADIDGNIIEIVSQD